LSEKEQKYSKRYVENLRAQINSLSARVQKYDSIAQAYDTKNKTNRNNKDGFKFWINVVLVFFTGVIATFAVLQFNCFVKFSETNNRAYLSVVNPVLDTLDAYGVVAPRVTYTIQNTGKTPAYKVTRFIILEDQWKSIGPVIPDTTNRSSEYIYAPGKFEDTTIFKQFHTVNDSSTIKKDEIRRFFYGRIKYYDIFDQYHWLTFAYELIFRHKKGGKFHLYPKYNNTDNK